MALLEVGACRVRLETKVNPVFKECLVVRALAAVTEALVCGERAVCEVMLERRVNPVRRGMLGNRVVQGIKGTGESKGPQDNRGF